MRRTRKHNLQWECQQRRFGRRLGGTAQGNSPTAKPERPGLRVVPISGLHKKTGERLGAGGTVSALWHYKSFLIRTFYLKHDRTHTGLFSSVCPSE